MKNKKLLFLIVTILIGCSVISPESEDKKVFDSFISISYLNIKNTLGLPTHTPYEDDDSNWRITYTQNSMHYFLSRSYSDRDEPILISTATRTFVIFTYYKQVTFIMKGDHCIDWQASK